jgi:cytochrome c-type biogenesis protein CcmH/NrfG
LFLQAQGEYLKGHWFEAESLLQQIIRRSPRDVEAQLMLATLYRHTRRVDEARQRLRLMEAIDGAERWRWEIDQEQRLLKQVTETAKDGEGRKTSA